MKKTFKYFRQGLMLMAAALAFVACSDDPADPEKPIIDPVVELDIQGAHFDESNETTSILLGDERSVSYTLTRNTDKGALTVPVKVLSASEGLNVPDVVVFKEGSATANYTVTAPQNVEEGSTYNFEVELEGADQFAENGATRFSATIAFPKKHQARMWFTGYVREYGYFLTDVYELGNGSFLFSDFMNSGTDFWVRYDKDATSTHEVSVTTEPSYIGMDEDAPGCYYMSCWQEDPENPEGDGTWTQFYPHGKDARVNIEYMTMYVSNDGYQACVYNPENQSGWFYLSTVGFSDQATEKYWVLLNWVITDDPENDGFDYSEPDEVIIDANAMTKFVGTYTFTGTDPYCEDASMTPKANYEVEIYMENDELRMVGFLGTPTDYNYEDSYFVGKWDEEAGTITFGDGAAGCYTYDGDIWYYVYDFKLVVGEDETGNITLTKDGTWHFYGYGADWLDASYSSMKFVKQ